MPGNYSQEFRARVVGLARDWLKDDPDQSQSRISGDVALKLGIGKESLHRWVSRPN